MPLVVSTPVASLAGVAVGASAANIEIPVDRLLRRRRWVMVFIGCYLDYSSCRLCISRLIISLWGAADAVSGLEMALFVAVEVAGGA